MHSDLLHVLTLLRTYLEFKSGEMSCANEKSFLPLKGSLFFFTVILLMLSELQSRTVWPCMRWGQKQVNHDAGVEIGV